MNPWRCLQRFSGMNLIMNEMNNIRYYNKLIKNLIKKTRMNGRPSILLKSEFSVKWCVCFTLTARRITGASVVSNIPAAAAAARHRPPGGGQQDRYWLGAVAGG